MFHAQKFAKALHAADVVFQSAMRAIAASMSACIHEAKSMLFPSAQRGGLRLPPDQGQGILTTLHLSPRWGMALTLQKEHGEAAWRVQSLRGWMALTLQKEQGDGTDPTFYSLKASRSVQNGSSLSANTLEWSQVFWSGRGLL